MKRLITSLAAAAILSAALPASAASYYGYVRNWWVQENGDITFYFLSNPDLSTTTSAHYVGGFCNAGIYTLQADKPNFNQLYTSLLLASAKNYRTILEVTSCGPNYNIVKMAKVCTWNGDC